MNQKKAFTLIELLVVIAIIALLLSIVIPSLSLAKKKAASIVCMANTKNLALAWFSYKEDNNDYIMSSCMNGAPISADRDAKTIPGWIDQPKDENGVGLSAGSGTVTDADEIRGIETGAIHPYLEAPDVFNCPADKVKSLYDTVDPEKFVTYAMPDCLAGKQMLSDPASYTQKRIIKFNQITSPGYRYNFVETAEERNFTVLGHFVFGSRELGYDPEVWWGPMALNHGDSSIVGYCDGHAERRKWQSKYTRERVEKLSREKTGSYNPDTASGRNASNDEDIAYMAKGWPLQYRR